MKTTVTGFRGYLGQRVFFKLKMLGLNPVGVDWGDKVSQSDVIVHLAARMDDTPEMLANNVGITLEVVKNADRIVFTSSAAVYGDYPKEVKIKETDKLNPVGLYGHTKRFEEMMIREFVENYSILRLANVYSHDATHGVVALLLKGDRVLYDKGAKTRDYVLVDDVVDVIVEAVLTKKWQGIYNIGTGKATSSLELFKRLCPDKKPIFKMKNEITHNCLDITKAEKNGFRPFRI